MVEAVSNPGTFSAIRRFRPHADLQGIRADYYNLTDLQGAPLAGLLVLMDRRGRPVRAEVHMHISAADTLYEIAVRQARRLITDRYNSDRPIRLYPLRVQLDNDPLSVQPQGSGRNVVPVSGSSNLLLMLFGVLLVLTSLFGGWFLNEWLSGDLAAGGTSLLCRRGLFLGKRARTSHRRNQRLGSQS